MEMIYLNNAATSYPKAPGTAEAVSSALMRVPGGANRGGIEDFNVFDAVREELSLLAGIDQHQCIGLGPHATWGLNLTIHGLTLDADACILTTNAEHNSVLRPLFALSQSRGIKVHHLPVDMHGRVRLEDWEEALKRHRPALCVVTHASNVTGAINDIEALTHCAHRYGSLILVDMAQSLGCTAVYLSAWGVDFAAFTGHKYLLGPQGTGGLYVHPAQKLNPLLTGGTGIHSDSDTMPPDMPLHIEAGTNNEPGFYGLLEALRWQRVNPWNTSETQELTESLIDHLSSLGARVLYAGQPSTPVVSFTLDGFSPALLGDILLENYDIIVRTGLHCAPSIFTDLNVDPSLGTVRVSLSRFTTANEIEELILALREIIQAGVW